MEGTPPTEEQAGTQRGPNLLSNPTIEQELETWRTTGICPFPEMRLQVPQQFQGFSRIELRLIQHLSHIYREMRLADFVGCTVWVQQIPNFIDAAAGHSFAMSSILAFSATHMAWITKSVETNNLAYHHRGIALKGLQDAIGRFSQDNSDAVLAASMLLSWQAADWASWKFNMQGISTVIGSMRQWKHLSRFSAFIDDHPAFFSGAASPIPYDDESVLLATNALRELSARLQNVHPVARQVQEILDFANELRSWSTSMQTEQLFEKLQPLRAWLFWLPVNLVKNNDISSAAMVLLAQLHTLAIAVDASLPELSGAALGCLTMDATEEIDHKLRSKVSVITPSEMHPSELDNLMHFARLMSARNRLQDALSNIPAQPKGRRQGSPYSFHRLSIGSQPGTPDYPPPISPALFGVIPVLANPSSDDLSVPPSPFLHYSEIISRRNSQLVASPRLSEHSYDGMPISCYSHKGDSPAYSPAAYSPVFLQDMPDDETWSFGGDSPGFTGGFGAKSCRIFADEQTPMGVFTFLVNGLGVKEVQFEELVALDAGHMRQQSPVYGVIFLFKYLSPEKPSDNPPDGDFDFEAAEKLFFAAQTIQNACGTQALLSVLLNIEDQVDIGPQLKEFKEFTRAFPPELRGEALSNSELVRDVHNSFARSSPFVSEDQKLATEGDDVYHFIAYAPINGSLYELDGLQPAPIHHGSCSFDEFPDKVIPVIQRRVARYPTHEIRFNLLAMVQDPRRRAQAIGDYDWLHREQQKRTAWQWENALRRHNFIGFIRDVLRAVTESKFKDGDDAYEEWIKDAAAKTKERTKEKTTETGKSDYKEADM
ncbi:MAG: hypothetical protein Q9163_002008 [Psora crenata]